MKNKDLQKLVLSTYQAGQTSNKIFQDLNGAVRNDDPEDWCHRFIETIRLSQNSSQEVVYTKD